MDFYIEIKILSDPEFPEPILINAAFKKLHKKLHDLTASKIGVSFPEYKVLLGNVLRLHGTEGALSAIADTKWLGGLAGYCEISEIKKVPARAKYRTVSRWQPTMSEANLRRLIKRGQVRGRPLSEEEIKSYRTKMLDKQSTKLPYIELQSGSNGHRHRRYIQFGELRDQPVEGEFDAFGLSKTATIPWF
jgi:CRISPR-associated endonuclease Csy4